MVKQREAELKQESVYLHVNVSDRSRIEEKIYPPEEFIVNQPQQSNRDLSPLCQLSKVAPHHLTPSVTPILSEERQIRTLERSVPLPVSTSHPPFTRHQSLVHFCSPPHTPSRDSYQSVCMLKLLWVHRGS